MAYFHGVKVGEIPTAIITPVTTMAGLPVIFGTAPVHLSESSEKYVNEPIICYDFASAKASLGYSADWKNYTLCEAMYAEFMLYAIKPAIFINVLDPNKHKSKVEWYEAPLVKGVATIKDAVIKSTLKVKDGINGTLLVENEDYTAAYNDNGELVITDIAGGEESGLSAFAVSYEKIDPSLVTKADIIGGADVLGVDKGLELINHIYTMFGQVPGIIIAPGWSEDAEVAAVMEAKASAINGLFRCIAIVDADTDACKKYTDVYKWKNNNNYTGNNEIVCWPKVKLGNTVYHMSTHIMGVIGQIDAKNNDIPFQSPSNLPMQISGICLSDGAEVNLNLDQCNLLNSQGIMTAINHSGGWRSWGNYTGAYPGATDVKDSFICVRRMFDWQYKTFIQNNWQKVDRPLTKRFVKTLVDSEQIRLNGLVSREYLLGAEVSYLESENPVTDLLQGIFRIHTKLTPTVPAQHIEETLEYDVNNFHKLFVSDE